jgi:hypothetical protein
MLTTRTGSCRLLTAEDRVHENDFQSADSCKEVGARRLLKANEKINGEKMIGKSITEQARCRRSLRDTAEKSTTSLYTLTLIKSQ